MKRTLSLDNRDDSPSAGRAANKLARCVRAAVTAGAVALACVLAAQAEWRAPATMPVVWLLSAAVLWPVFSGRTAKLLQTLVGCYLCLAPVTMSMTSSFALALLGRSFSVSAALPPLAILAGWYLVSTTPNRRARQGGLQGLMLCGGAAALLVPGLHGALLAVLLHATHGYGYARTAPALGWGLLFALAFATFWQALDDGLTRRIIAIVIAGFCAMLMLGGVNAP